MDLIFGYPNISFYKYNILFIILQFFIGRYEKLQDYKQRFLDWHVLRGITNNKRAEKIIFHRPTSKPSTGRFCRGNIECPLAKGKHAKAD